MRVTATTRSSSNQALAQIVFCAITLTFLLTTNTPAQSDKIPGVQNFTLNPNDDSVDDKDKDSDKASSKSKDKDKKSAKSRKKNEDKELKQKKKDDGADDDSQKDRSEDVSTEAPPAPQVTVASLLSNGGYIALGDAIKRARNEGGTGDLLKVDLEWDVARTVATWDLTFSSGDEYELDATSGAFLGKKSKAGPKLAVLAPLPIEGKATAKMLTFQEVIRRVEANRKQKVLEMELKRNKERPETIFEVALVDGTTMYLDAITGEPVPGS